MTLVVGAKGATTHAVGKEIESARAFGRVRNDGARHDLVAVKMTNNSFDNGPGGESEIESLRIAHVTDLHIGPLLGSTLLRSFVAQINALVTSPGWEQNLPQLISVLDRAESKTEEAVDHAFRQSLLLIAVFLGGSLLTALVYQWLKRKLFSPGTGSPAA